jgi:hypothetical protein
MNPAVFKFCEIKKDCSAKVFFKIKIFRPRQIIVVELERLPNSR